MDGRALKGAQYPGVELGEAGVGLDEEDVVLAADDALQVDHLDALGLHKSHQWHRPLNRGLYRDGQKGGLEVA